MKINPVSVVIPIYNEAENIHKLYNEIINELSNRIDFEIIFVDDASCDKTNLELNKINNIIVVNHKKNIGQSNALLSGIKIAKYETIVTIDGDCQNDPKDIFKLLKIYSFNEEIKLVGGLRKKRNDSIIKIYSSKIANTIRSRILNDDCIDTGCGLKIINKNIFLSLPFFDGIHRFLPALIKGFGYKTVFAEVNHRKRMRGISKYGTLKRLLFGIKDIIRVKKIIKRKNNVQ